MNYLLYGLESARVFFREMKYHDYATWLEYFRDPKTSERWFYERKAPKKACDDWYHHHFARIEPDQGGMNALLEKESGSLIGHCGLLVQRVDGIQELEIGYGLLPAYWGKGYATEAVSICIKAAFQRGLADSLICIISPTNLQSERVALKNGLLLEKVTTYHGNQVNIYRIRKQNFLF
jgi:ribosomal-protein-alanine N-acetyltransferase